jgi:hypothetical protein
MGLCKLITTSQVATFLWHITHKIFDIPARHKDLLTWSWNSIYVTAVILQHQDRFSDSYIKNWLCWCSDTFLMYLCNTFYTTHQHMAAINLGLDPPTWDIACPLEPHKHIPCPSTA